MIQTINSSVTDFLYLSYWDKKDSKTSVMIQKVY